MNPRLNSSWRKTFKDFLHGPTVKNLSFNAGDGVYVPGRGTMILHNAAELCPLTAIIESRGAKTCTPQFKNSSHRGPHFALKKKPKNTNKLHPFPFNNSNYSTLCILDCFVLSRFTAFTPMTDSEINVFKTVAV